MKISRRNVIKGLGTGLCTGLCTTTLATQLPTALADTRHGTPATEDTLRVQIAHQWGGESITAVLKNTSDHSATITRINSVSADYGRFNFEDLTKNGPLTLSAGEEVYVPFTVMGTPAKPYGHFDNRLQKHLKESLKISTNNQFAKVSTAAGPKLV